MSRIRTIKPEFWTSEQIMECSPLARLAFIGMWNFCDDNGVHPASCKTLKAEVFPGDDLTASNVQELVNELLRQQLIATFLADSRPWWVVTGWHHQLINRPSKSRYPLPPRHAPLTDSVSIHGGLTESSVSIHGGLTVGGEGKGGEGKGEEGNGREGRETRTRKEKFPLPDDWQPDASTYALLEKQGIDRPFAESCLDEFRLYWQENGERRAGWEATFLNSVKRSWERQQSSKPRNNNTPHDKQAKNQSAISEWLSTDRDHNAIEGTCTHEIH